MRASIEKDALVLFAPQSGVLRVLDARGREAANVRVLDGQQTIALPGLAPGVNTVVLYGEGKRVMRE